MSKTPNLFDLPKTGLSRNQKLKAFKQQHGIETVRALHVERKDCPWSAAHMAAARKFGYGVTEQSDIYDCVCKVGRLMEESGCLVFGETEREAIRELCANLKIEFPTV